LPAFRRKRGRTQHSPAGKEKKSREGHKGDEKKSKKAKGVRGCVDGGGEKKRSNN